MACTWDVLQVPDDCGSPGIYDACMPSRGVPCESQSTSNISLILQNSIAPHLTTLHKLSTLDLIKHIFGPSLPTLMAQFSFGLGSVTFVCFVANYIAHTKIALARIEIYGYAQMKSSPKTYRIVSRV